MRLAFAQNLPYLSSSGGATKAWRLLIEGLGARGHECRVVAQSLPGISDPQSFVHNGVTVYTSSKTEQVRHLWIEQLRSFTPDWVLVASEDPAQILLESAIQICPHRVVSVVQTAQMLPFGPQSFLASSTKTALFHRTAGIISISHYLRDYIRQWSGLDSAVLPMPVYGQGPFPDLSCFDQGYIAQVNPCAVKGIDIFVALAQRFPDWSFAAVPAWETTLQEQERLQQISNITLLPSFSQLQEFFSQTRVLLVPSLWAETFGYIVVEAMLHGIPVLASHVGGLPEAKLGVDYILPVQPIERYLPQLNELMLPIPQVPPQPIEPWAQALQDLLADPQRYYLLAQASRRAAHQFLDQIGPEAYERYLTHWVPRSPTRPTRIATVPTSGDLMDLIASLSLERRAWLAQWVRQQQMPSSPGLQLKPLPRQGDHTDRFPLSFAQRRLWFLDRLNPNQAFYLMPAALRLQGDLDRKALQQTVTEILHRHESLRTRFVEWDGQPWQQISPQANLNWAEVDLRSWPQDQRQDQAQYLAQQEAHRPFDLTQGPLLRASLMQLGDQDHVLIVVMHHIISDGWSVGNFIRELTQIYTAFSQGQNSPLAPLPIQYADYSVWQHQFLQGKVLQDHLDYWRTQLRDLPTLQLPTDHDRPHHPTGQGGYLPMQIPLDLSQKLEDLSQAQGVTVFMTLLAAFQTLLHRYTDQDRIPIGTAIANRGRKELEGLIGFFANTLVLCSDLGQNPRFTDILTQVKETTLDAYAHQDLPFERIVEELQPDRHSSINPLFQVVFALQNAPSEELRLPGLTLTPVPLDLERIKFDLELHLWPSPDGFQGVMGYSQDLFEAETIQRWSAHFLTLLQGIVEDPARPIAELPLLTATEVEQWSISEPALEDLDDLLSAIESLPADTVTDLLEKN